MQKTITPQDLQTVWEQLNGLMYDIENWNDLSDMGETIQDCIERLEALGAHQENEVTK